MPKAALSLRNTLKQLQPFMKMEHQQVIPMFAMAKLVQSLNISMATKQESLIISLVEVEVYGGSTKMVNPSKSLKRHAFSLAPLPYPKILKIKPGF